MGAFRKRLEKVVGDKHEEVMGRMGAIMATGAPAHPRSTRSPTMHACVAQQEMLAWVCMWAMHRPLDWLRKLFCLAEQC